jgi:hypothetical protein
MLKFCVEQWDKNKGKLEQDIINNLKEYNDYSYKELIKKVVALVINDKDSDYGDDWDSEHITEIDNGDYQGTLLYMIPLKTYQPAEYDYLMTYVGYGSCSGCDTLQAIQMWYWDDKDVEVPTFKQNYKCNSFPPFTCPGIIIYIMPLLGNYYIIYTALPYCIFTGQFH